ncbi:DUF4105 domain-containing protein [Spirosoma knui]
MDVIRWLVFLFQLACFVGVSSYYAVSQQLSSAARISLITYGPGDDDISSRFGHTEIRLVDPILGIDQNYSYGGFNYRASWFIPKFLSGTLSYYVEVHPLREVAYYYQQTNRSIQEQLLNLSATQRQRLIDALETNCLAQNRYYRYKFYYDNCATRPRDMIADACGDSLMIPHRLRMTGKSYRDWMNEYLTAQPWYQLGMNLALGKPSDQQTDGWQAMYLPDQLADQLRQATIRQSTGQVIPLIQREQTLFAAQKIVHQPTPFVATPIVVFTLLSILVTGLKVRRYVSGKKADRWLDRLLFGVSGFLGWFLLVLWMIRDDGVTSWNPTLLVLMPLHLPFVFWVTRSSATLRLRAIYFGITALFIGLGMALSKIPGGVDIVYPLMLLVRCLVNCQPVLTRSQVHTQVT